RTIAVIQQIRHTVPVVFASSRMPSAMRHLQKQLGLTDHPMICYNGGLTCYMDNDDKVSTINDSVQIPLHVCRRILELSAGIPVHISLYADNSWFVQSLDKWAAKEEMGTKVSPTVMAFDDVIQRWDEEGNGAHKVMCMGTEENIQRLYIELHTHFSADIHIYRSKSTYLELAARQVSKATALRALMDRVFHVDMSDVMAFGDNYNDIEMVRSVGWGIAVGNARSEVKEVAREITETSREDGVALALERHFLSI
ncbi:MAG TPA: Cof-type HAD-IIB family hydrolase, partial [Chryseolinea sp.]|nr:Cof-type HAD-IIB family hydrolase [Chryseolinea sp.]